MTWEEVTRDDAHMRRDEPVISVSKDRIHFHACVTRMAQLSAHHKAKLFVDSDSFRIGFRFVTDDDSQAFPLRAMNPSQPGSGGVWCTGRGLGSKYRWIRRIAMLHSKKDRQFVPKKDGDRWTIQLPPSFERRSDRAGTRDSAGGARHLSVSRLKRRGGLYRPGSHTPTVECAGAEGLGYPGRRIFDH